MSNEAVLRHLVAFLYQRSGRRAMSENEIANAVSLDLKWYAPKTARSLVAGLVRAGWLERDEDGDLEPTFDVKAVSVPIGFRAPAELPGDLPPPGTFQPQSSETSRASSIPTPASAPASPPVSAPAPQRAAAEPTTSGPSAATPPSSPSSVPQDDVPETLLGSLLARLESATGRAPGDWVQRMDAVVQRTGDAVTPEVALLLAAAKEGVDVAPWLQEVRARLA